MSKTVTCDRCGTNRHSSASEVILRPGDTTWTEVFDLCGKCFSKLRHSFLKPVEAGDAAKAGVEMAERAIQYASHEAGKAAAGLLETVAPTVVNNLTIVKRPWWKFWA